VNITHHPNGIGGHTVHENQAAHAQMLPSRYSWLHVGEVSEARVQDHETATENFTKNKDPRLDCEAWSDPRVTVRFSAQSNMVGQWGIIILPV
jgi:hypothetical protein